MVDDKAYKGLAPYGEDDSELFFGRTDEVRHLRDRVLASRVTVPYGPSGVGKSSLLRAGLAAELTAENVRRIARGDENARADCENDGQLAEQTPAGLVPTPLAVELGAGIN